MVRMITPNTHTSLISRIQHETVFLGLRRDQRRGPGDLVPCRRRQGSVVGAEVGQRSRPSSRLDLDGLQAFSLDLVRRVKQAMAKEKFCCFCLARKEHEANARLG